MSETGGAAAEVGRHAEGAAEARKGEDTPTPALARVEEAVAGAVRVGVLGAVAVRRGGGAWAEVVGQRPKALLVALALAAPRSVSAEQLIDDIWGDEPPRGARAALQTLVSRVRSTHDDAGIESTGAGYRLDGGPDAIDLGAAGSAVSRGRMELERGDAAAAADAAAGALTLWRGDPGADLAPGPLAEALRAGADDLATATARLAVESALALGDPAAAEQQARRLVALRPFDDSAQLLLLRTLDALGRPTEALASYAAYSESVRDAFGTSPSTQLQALHLDLLDRELPAPTTSHAPGHGAAAHTTHPESAPEHTPATASTPTVAASIPASGTAAPGGPAAPTADSPRLEPAPTSGTAAPGGPAAPTADFPHLEPARAAELPDPAAAAPPSTTTTPRADAPGLPTIPPTESTAPARRATVVRGVRAAPNALIGRDGALAEIEQLLEHTRVTTVLGPGGLGKTRIAHEVAGRAVATQRYGAVIVAELAGVRSGDDVIFGLASAVGIREAATSTRIGEPVPRAHLRERLVGRLGETPTLLVVDNCEHVIDAAAEWVAALTAELPTLTVLTTSRTPLALSSERVYALAPLGSTTPDAPDDDAAVRLFLDRATAVRPDAVLPRATVARLCERLDGLPLAIELAAARIRSLSLDEIERRLSNRFALLTGGDRSAPERHRTLLAVIEWSWNLLGRAEQRALAELSEFADGFGAESAAALLGAGKIGAGTIGADELETVELLDGLIAQSLVTVRETPTGSRYRMLETVREFGQRRLDEAGRRAEVLEALFAWADGFATSRRPHLDGPRQVATFGELRAEEDNLIDVLRRAIDAERPEIVCSVFALLGYCWTLRSAHGEVLGFSRPVFASVRHYEPAPERVDSLAELLVIIAATTLLSDLRFGVQPLGRLRRLVRTAPVGEPRLAAMAELLLAAGRDDGMRAAIERARASSDRPTAMLGSLIGSVLAENDGERAQAVASARHAAQLARGLDDVWGESMAAQMLSALFAQSAEPAQALRWAATARAGLERLGALGDLQQLDWVVANSTLAMGEVAEAERLYDRLLELPGETDGVDFRSIALAGQAEVLRAAGRPDEARLRFGEAVHSFGAPVGRASPWYRILLSAMLSALVVDGTGSPDERLALARRLRARVLAGLRGGRYVDRPVLGASIVGLAVWLDSADDDGSASAVELLALADAMGSRQDSPALHLAPLFARFAAHTDPAAIDAARRAASALPRAEGPERVAALLRAPGPWSR